MPFPKASLWYSEMTCKQDNVIYYLLCSLLADTGNYVTIISLLRLLNITRDWTRSNAVVFIVYSTEVNNHYIRPSM